MAEPFLNFGNVGLVVCLDSGAGNYEQLWLTTSLRGMVSGVLKVEVLSEGIHSGDNSGIVPSSFRILRQVLDRLEDSRTGELHPQSFYCEIPEDRIEETHATAVETNRPVGGVSFNAYPKSIRVFVDGLIWAITCFRRIGTIVEHGVSVTSFPFENASFTNAS